MGSQQGDFKGIFTLTFGPRNNFEPRVWQSECKETYQESIETHINRHSENEGAFPQHRFTIYAGTGSGKTKASAYVAASMLNSHHIKYVVVVCPNRCIKRKTRDDFLNFFGIDLVSANNKFTSRYADGIPPAKQGYILTYGHMMSNPRLHKRICSYGPTMVIFDEVHHLGDHEDKEWSKSALKAFGDVPFVVAMTGTPWRTDDVRIPFVTYDPTPRKGVMRFMADPKSGTGYTYSLARAVNDGVCRFPQFMWHNGVVKIRLPQDNDAGKENVIVVSFDDKVNDTLSAARLRGAVLYGTPTRREMLIQALDICRRERRRVGIFLGGDTQADDTPTIDAKERLPSELAEMGINASEYEIITSDDDDAQRKIAEFGQSDKWIMISVNMMSEGTDNPELSALIFLTSITTKQSMVQRIGRALRSRGKDDPYQTALIFMFRHPGCVEFAQEILDEIDVDLILRKSRDPGEGGGEGPGANRYRIESAGIEGGGIVSGQMGKGIWPFAEMRNMQARLHAANLPSGMAETALKLTLLEIDHANALAH